MTRAKPTPSERAALRNHCPTCQAQPAWWCQTYGRAHTGTKANRLHSSRLQRVAQTDTATPPRYNSQRPDENPVPRQVSPRYRAPLD